MSDSRGTTGFSNYPSPEAHELPYEAPPQAKNPVVKGPLLNYLSQAVLTIPGVPALLWSNAGFGSLRKRRELDNVEARFDPTVIPLRTDAHAQPTTLPTFDVTKLRVLPHDTKGRFSTVADFHNAYKSGQSTPSDVVDALLPLIRRGIEARSPHSKAFVDTRVEDVKEAATASTKRWRDGRPLGILDGVPFAVKDEMDFKGYGRYCGTTTDFTGGKDVESSWCALKLEEAGAVMVGKLNMHELGMDTTNNNPNWGTPLNPYNKQYYTGGSSGGAAYAVASGLIPFAIGSDGGGSVRIPSNYCGIYGLKPSHGRVSIAPTTSIANTTVVQGPLAANMSDLEIAYHILSQPDPSNHISRQFAPSAPLSTPRNKTLGIPTSWFDRADPDVQEPCRNALQYFVTELNYTLIPITIPLVHEGQLAHAMTILAEAASADTSLWSLTPANRILMKVANQTPATDFLLAQRLRNLLMQHLAHLFRKYPGLIIVTPTTPNAGWPIGDGELAYGVSNGNMQVRNMEFVWLANFTGVPCLQMPVGYAEPEKGEGKVAVGLSGMAEWGSEDILIEFGYECEEWFNQEAGGGGRKRPEVWVDILGSGKA